LEPCSGERPDVLGKAQCPLDQLPPAVLVSALDQHAIERERGLSQPVPRPGDTLFGDLDAVIVTARSCVDQRQLRLEDACRVLLIEVVRRDSTAV
jgi:hypothetical protein